MTRRKPTARERAADAARQAALAELLLRKGPWDVVRMMAVIIAYAAENRPEHTVCANDVRAAVAEYGPAWLVGPAFNSLKNPGGPLEYAGRVASDLPNTHAHKINVYRLRPEWLGRPEERRAAA